MEKLLSGLAWLQVCTFPSPNADQRQPEIRLQRHTAIGQRVRPLVARVAGMPLDPVPFNLVHAAMHQRIQPLPQVGVFDGLPGSRFPPFGLPPMNLDATDRTTLLEMYSIKNVFKNQVLSVWPEINQEILNAYLYYTQAPGYFAQQGFEQAGTAPSDLYKPLSEKIKTLAPYNPASILNMSIKFDE